jgi:hypothetical protein
LTSSQPDDVSRRHTKGRIMPRNFTDQDVIPGELPRIYATRDELIHKPTTWQLLGLQESRTGYGKKLNSGLMIQFNGRKYRIYTTIFSNAGSNWFTVRGRKIWVS